MFWGPASFQSLPYIAELTYAVRARQLPRSPSGCFLPLQDGKPQNKISPLDTADCHSISAFPCAVHDDFGTAFPAVGRRPAEAGRNTTVPDQEGGDARPTGFCPTVYPIADMSPLQTDIFTSGATHMALLRMLNGRSPPRPVVPFRTPRRSPASRNGSTNATAQTTLSSAVITPSTTRPPSSSTRTRPTSLATASHGSSLSSRTMMTRRRHCSPRWRIC